MEVDVAVVGGGIVGLASARELRRRHPELRIRVLEREERVGTHQTGHNSGVIHAGIYYAPGSLKARLCAEGARALYAFCDEHGVPYERSGKVIVARHEGELARLDELERRGRENAVPGLRRLSPAELEELEPHCRGLAALHSPETGVVDFGVVARALAAQLTDDGIEVVTRCPVVSVTRAASRIVLRHPEDETTARFAVFCAGLSADRLAVMAGESPDPRVVPFRGNYLQLRPERASLVRGLIYPVPDPNLPFLGVHLSRHIDGTVTLGPSALLAPRRDTLTWPGTWRMARRWWRTGASELARAASRRLAAREAAEYVPELRASDLEPGFHGVRAQAVARDGRLVDDFVVSRGERALHVRNAPSPAATASLALAGLIADEVDSALG
ncbi:MAG: (S)-2-hydroxyglutarate dehydrogenase [Thermoleophilaceae bacterium]|nr:(S)-2-hydroxyglutarate dehydrogenase [Thermoleophilaceae bacterium]